MSNILIPVDYSFASHNAYHFGLHLAQKMGLDVLLVHYYSGAINPNEPLQFSGDGSIHGGHLSRLRQFAYPSGDGTKYALVSPPAGVNLTYETATSLAPSADILKRARSEDVALVVMATRSTKRILGSWLGSTATTVSEACERPVFLIPPEVTFRQFDRIVVANNRTTADPLPLWEIEGMANLYEAKVHFVHVEHPRKDLPLRFAPWELMDHLAYERSADSYPFEVVSVEDRDIPNGLLDYAEEIGADLITIVNRRRSRWQAVLRPTLTQQLALRARLPVLVLHTDKELQPTPKPTEYQEHYY